MSACFEYMYFIITTKPRKLLLLHNLENSFEIKTEMLKDNYSLVIVREELSKIVSTLIAHEIKSKILSPFISEEMYKELSINKYNNIRLKTNVSESATLSRILFFKNDSSDKYLYMGPKTESIKDTLLKIRELNSILEEHDLYITEEMFLLKFRDLLIKAIENTILKEAKEDYYTISSIEAQNETFTLSCIAEFILLASEYYTKDEIKEYLETEVLSELDSGFEK